MSIDGQWKLFSGLSLLLLLNKIHNFIFPCETNSFELALDKQRNDK